MAAFLTGCIGEAGGLELPTSPELTREAAHGHRGSPKGIVADCRRLVGLGRDVVRRPGLGSRTGGAARQDSAGRKHDDDHSHGTSVICRWVPSALLGHAFALNCPAWLSCLRQGIVVDVPPPAHRGIIFHVACKSSGSALTIIAK
jgi:hypothetical protein